MAELAIVFLTVNIVAGRILVTVQSDSLAIGDATIGLNPIFMLLNAPLLGAKADGFAGGQAAIGHAVEDAVLLVVLAGVNSGRAGTGIDGQHH